MLIKLKDVRECLLTVNKGGLRALIVASTLVLLLARIVSTEASSDTSSDTSLGQRSSPGKIHFLHQPAGVRSLEMIRYSEFNHHMAGLGVFLLGSLALAMELRLSRHPDSRHILWLWPLGWLLLGCFLFIRNDPESWPWTARTLEEALRNPETAQHLAAVVAVLAIGLIEGLRSAGYLKDRKWAFFFPILGIGMGVLLSLHSQIHAHGLPARVTWHHVTGSVLAVILSVSKLIREWQGPTSRIAPILWPSLLMLFGVDFLFYSEQ